MPELEDLTYKERLKEMHLTTLKERRWRGNLITIHKLMNNLKETDRKELILTRKERLEILKGHKKKLQKEICLKDTKKYTVFPKEV